MKQSAEQMDECYGHWVDYVLVKEDPASALAELQLVLERVHVEPQWVPVSWVRRWTQLNSAKRLDLDQWTRQTAGSLLRVESDPVFTAVLTVPSQYQQYATT